MDTKSGITRRDVLALGGAIIATSAVPHIAQAVDRVSESDPTAIALGYKHDASAVDTTKWGKRAGEAGARQFCDNCALYGAQGEGWGTCSIFQGRLVAGKGWCNAWVQG
jgi:hypothetical protein